MAHDSKRGFLSSLFGKKKQTEEEATADLESRQRLEARIQQILAEKAAAPELLMMEENHDPAISEQKEEEAEIPVELLPISASVISIRKTPVSSSFMPSGFDVPRSYAANQR